MSNRELSPEEQLRLEARRIAGAFHIANALIANWKDDDRGFRQNMEQIAIQSVKCSDMILAYIEASEPGDYPALQFFREGN
jgi:hypothetical protein